MAPDALPPSGESPTNAGDSGQSLAHLYLQEVSSILARIGSTQGEAIEQAARLCADVIGSDHLVHVFGSGHSRILVEELWPRYGSFPGFHPIVELSLTAYHQVTGANGQRQAMFLENVPGLAARIVRNFSFGSSDAFIGISAGGTSVVTVEMAESARDAGMPVVAITALDHSRRAAPKAPSGHRLCDVADIVLDTCTPVGDAAIPVPGLAPPVGPTTTVAGAVLVNALKVRTAELLVVDKGVTPAVLPSPLLVGEEEASRAFEAAYDEHARRVAMATGRQASTGGRDDGSGVNDGRRR
jgi:uncharacterized phosphosugar-binding protein